jgi:sec-independent protein translocase protein TatB
MPSFPDTAVLVLLALLLFGPKKLPVLARQLGKLMADFRRASNEFRTQMEEELRISEQAERQKQVAAIEAAAPPTAAETTPAETTVEFDEERDNPHIPPPAPSFVSTSDSGSEYADVSPTDAPAESSAPESASDSSPAPLPIAVSGDLSIMPPSTGLPVATSSPTSPTNGTAPQHEAELETETLHG